MGGLAHASTGGEPPIPDSGGDMSGEGTQRTRRGLAITTCAVEAIVYKSILLSGVFLGWWNPGPMFWAFASLMLIAIWVATWRAFTKQGTVGGRRTSDSGPLDCIDAEKEYWEERSAFEAAQKVRGEQERSKDADIAGRR